MLQYCFNTNLTDFKYLHLVNQKSFSFVTPPPPLGPTPQETTHHSYQNVVGCEGCSK